MKLGTFRSRGRWAVLAAIFAVGVGGALAQTTVLWGGGSGSWNTGANWTGGVPPGPADTAQIAAGAATVDSNVSIAKLLLSGGNIGGTATLTVTGAGSAWSGGTMNSSAASTATIDSGATLTISGAADHDFNFRAVTNSGTVNWTGGNLRSGNAGSFTNNAAFNDSASGTSSVQFNNAWGGAAVGFANSLGATYTKSATGTTAFSGVAFNNSGAVAVTAGTLSLNGGGTAASTGTFTASSGATLNFGGGTSTLADGASLSGAGTFSVSAGTLSVSAGTANLSNLTVNGGTLAGVGTASIGALTESSGTISIAAFTLTGASTWSSGTWNSSSASTALIDTGATLAISSASDHDFNFRDIVNNGTVNWTAGRLRSGNAGSILNQNIWNDSTAGSLGANDFNNDWGGTAWVFTNAATGTYNKSGSGTTRPFIAFNNDGVININAGTLELHSGGTNSSTGSINVVAGASLLFKDSYTIADGSSLLGAGSYQLQAGTLTVNGTVNVSSFTITGGTLAGTQTFAGGLIWSGGSLNAGTAATTTIGTSSGLAISSTSDHDFNRRAIVNNGTVNWTTGRIRSGNSGSIVNNSAWNDSTAGALGANDFNNDWGGTPWVFTNAATGTYNKSGSGTTRFFVPLNNDGVVNVTSGTLNLSGGGATSAAGTFSVNAGAGLIFGDGTSTLANGTALTGAGTFSATGGTLSVAAGTATLPNLAVNGGTLAGAGTASIGALTETSGTISISTLSLTGASSWSGGSMNSSAASTATINSGATLGISSSADHDFNRRNFVNNGTVNWSAGRLRSGNAGSILNQNIWNDSTAGSVGANDFNNDWGGTAWVFTNAATGTYNKSGAGTTRTFIDFNNDGAVNLTAGTLEIHSGGTNSATGSFNVAAGAAVLFKNSYTIADGSSLLGAGSYQLQGGTLTVGGTVNVNNFTIVAGTLGGSQTFAGGLTWSGGNLNVGAAVTTTIAAGSTLAISSGADHDFQRRAIVNNGTVNWQQGRLRSGSSGSILNNSIWNDATAGLLGANDLNNDYGGTSWVFTNAAGASYNKSGAGTTRFFMPLVNSGTLALGAGTLQIHGGATFNHGSSQTGAGLLQLSAGTLTANGTISLANFNMAGGTISGTHTLLGALSWTAGTLNNTGSTTIGGTGALTISGTADHDMTQHVLINDGAINWTGGRIRGGSSATLTNNATFNDTASNVVNNDYGGTAFAFTNAAAGTYHKLAAGTTRFDTTFNNSGLVNIDAGTLQLNGGGTLTASGTLAADAGTTVNFSNSYTIADASKLTGAGTYQISGGTVSLSGSVAANNLQILGGTTTGTHTFTAGATWNIGFMNAAATTTNAAGSTFVIATGADHDFTQRSIVNNGVVNWQQGRLRSGSGGAITNNNVWNDSNSGTADLNNDYGGATLVFTNAAGGTYNKTGAGTTRFLVPLTNQGNFNLGAGTVQIHTGGTFGNGSSQTGTAPFQLVAGTITATGTMSLSNFQMTGGAIAGAHTFNGGITWTAGNFNNTGSTTIGPSGTLAITSTNFHDLDRHTFVNDGVVNWTAGQIRGGTGATFTNNATFNDAASSFVNNAYGGAAFAFVNAPTGVYNKTGAGTTQFDTTFNNNGLVNIDAGTLQINGGGTQGGTGVFAADAGAVVDFSNNHTITDASKLTGAGTYRISGGTVSLSGSVAANNLQIAGGNTIGTHTFTAGATWNAGTMNAAATTTNAAGSTLIIATGADHDYNLRSIVNNGTVNWTGGRLRGGTGSSITNNSLWNDSASSTFNSEYGGATSSFTNAAGATYRKNAAGTTTVSIPFVNSGTVDVQAGTLSLGVGATFNHGSTIQGTGLTQLTGGTLSASGTISVQNFKLAGGTLPGTQTFSGNWEWASGNLNGAGMTTHNGGVLTIGSTADHDFSARAIVNQSTVNWTGGRLRSGQGGSIVNTGTWNDSASNALNNDYAGTVWTFSNNGTYQKTAAGTTTFQIPVTNTGTIRSQAGTLSYTSSFTNTGGSLIAAGGNFSFSNPLNVDTGTIGGAGTFTASTVTAGGQVNPGNSAGLLNIAGNLTLLGTATTHFEIGGLTRGGQYDAIDVTGTAALAGTLQFSFLNGAYASLQGTDSFTLLGAASVTGGFGNIASGSRLNSADGVGSFQVNITGTNLTLSQFILSATTFIWSGGDLNTLGNVTPSLLVGNTLAAGASLAIATTADHTFAGQAVVNNGTMDWQAGLLRSGNGSTFTNSAGGVFNDSAGSQIDNPFGGGFTFVNNGTYNKTGGGTTQVAVPFNNNANVNVVSGEFRLNGGGTNASTGQFTTSLGATTSFTGDYTLAANSALKGQGVHQLLTGTLTVSGDLVAGLLNFNSGTLAGTHTLHGNYGWSGSSWNSAGTTTIASDGVLNITGAADHNFSGRNLTNTGTTNWQGGFLRSGNSGSFTNAASAILNDSASSHIDNPFGGGFSVTNNGTFNKTAAGTTHLDVAFTNSGVVNVQAGEFRLNGGGTNASTGFFNTAADATTTINSGYSLADGTQLTGPGSYQLIAGGLTVSGNLFASLLNLVGGQLAGTHTLQGSYAWSGGDWNTGGTTTIAAGGVLNIVGAGDHSFSGRQVVNTGVTNWQGGFIRSGNGGTLTNSAGAFFNDSASSHIDNPFGGSFVFTNNGTFSKTAVGTTFLDVPFNNNANVNIQTGELRLNGGGTNSPTGFFNAGLGSTLTFNGNYSLADGSTLGGSGTHQLLNGVLAINGNLGATLLNFAGGQLDGSHTLRGNFNWSAGNWNTGGTTTIASDGILNVIAAADHNFSSRALSNNGVINWQEGYLRSGNSGSLTNASGAFFNDAASAHIDNPVGGSFGFTNNGTYNKTAAGTTHLDVPFTNAGVANVQLGEFRLNGGGTNASTGVFHTSAGALTTFNGNYALANGTQLLGAGVYQLTSGAITITGSLRADAFSFAGGQLAGSHTLHGTFNWSGGDWNVGGSTEIASDGILSVTGAGDHNFSSRTVTNSGVFNWQGGYLRSGNNGSLLNTAEGIFNDTASSHIDNPFGGTFSFTNNGVFNKSAAGITSIDVPFVNNNGAIFVSAGTLRFASSFQQSAGTVALANDAIVQFDQGLNFEAGILAGTGTINGDVSNSGLLSPGTSAGSLTITGNLTLLGASALLIELGGTTPGTGHDFLSVGGNATLGGMLNVKFVGGFEASANASHNFTVLTTVGGFGTTAFNNVANGQILFTSDGFGSFQVNFGAASAFAANSLVLSNFVPVPEPSTWALLLAGLGVVALAVRRRR